MSCAIGRDVALGSMSDEGSDDELFGPAYSVPPTAPPSEPPRGRHASAAAFGSSHIEQQKVAVEVDTTAPKRGPSQNTMQSAAPKFQRTAATADPVHGYGYSHGSTQAPAFDNNNCLNCGKAGHWAADCPHISHSMLSRLPSKCHLCSRRIKPGERISKPSVGPWSGKWNHGSCTLAWLVDKGYVTAQEAARVRNV